MNGLLLAGGALVLMGVITALFVLFSTPQEVQPRRLQPFAVVPVPDGQPATKAFLEYYAGQLAWMDSEVFCAVILTCRDTDVQACEMCCELCRQYDFMQFLPLSRLQGLLEEQLPDAPVLENAEKS